MSSEARKKHKEEIELRKQKEIGDYCKESKNIPKEHLLKAIEQLAYGLSYESMLL